MTTSNNNITRIYILVITLDPLSTNSRFQRHTIKFCHTRRDFTSRKRTPHARPCRPKPHPDHKPKPKNNGNNNTHERGQAEGEGEFTDEELLQIDTVNYAAYKSVCDILHIHEEGEEEWGDTLPWDMEWIGELSDLIVGFICERFHKDEKEIYPYLER